MLKVQLVTRFAQGLQLTEAGQALLAPARAMRQAAADLGMAAAGRAAGLDGTVRITASKVVSHAFLPPILARLRADEPGIQIDLIPSDTTENLLLGEADLALRMYRPTQLDLVAQKLADLPMGIYAARSFLDRHGRPASAKALMRLDFIGQDRGDQIIRAMAAFGYPAVRSFFPVRTDDPLVYQDLIRAGCGVGGLLRRIGDGDPMLERIDGLVTMPVLPVWLVAAPALRQSPRLRRVWDALATAFAA